MPQIFHPSTNTIARLSLFGILFLVIGALWLAAAVARSSYVTEENVVRLQPVPFSHDHHVAGLGIDCRYCHTSVEVSSFAGIPPTATCMNCHSQIWANAPLLEPVRASFRNNTPLTWVRVNDLPDFVYFNHQIHVKQGVGCATCHGPVDKMALTYQATTMQMEWCLDCHRAPEKYLRPRSEVFNMAYEAPANQLELGRALKKEYNVAGTEHMTSCSVCHR